MFFFLQLRIKISNGCPSPFHCNCFLIVSMKIRFFCDWLVFLVVAIGIKTNKIYCLLLRIHIFNFRQFLFPFLYQPFLAWLRVLSFGNSIRNDRIKTNKVDGPIHSLFLSQMLYYYNASIKQLVFRCNFFIFTQPMLFCPEVTSAGL